MREEKTGPLGFEPRNGGTKTRCLTTWRRPNEPASAMGIGLGKTSVRNRRLASYPQRLVLRQLARLDPGGRPASGGEDPQALLAAPAEHGAAQPVAVHQLGLHGPHRFAAGQQLHRTALGQHHLLHRQPALLQGGMGIVEARQAARGPRPGRVVAPDGARSCRRSSSRSMARCSWWGLSDLITRIGRPRSWAWRRRLRITSQLAAHAQHRIGLLRLRHHLAPAAGGRGRPPRAAGGHPHAVDPQRGKGWCGGGRGRSGGQRIGQGHPATGAGPGRAGAAAGAPPGPGHRRRRGGAKRFVVAQHQAPVGREFPHLGTGRLAPQQQVHGAGHVAVHEPAVAAAHLHRQGEGGFGGPLQHRLLGAAAAGLLVPQGHRLDPAHQIAEGGIADQVGQFVAMGRGHQHHAPFGDGAGRLGLQLGADLIDHDDLGHVVLHRLDHHLVLQLRPGHLHAPGAADGRMGDVAVAGDLVAGVDHHHPPLQVVGQHPGDLPQGGGLAHPRTAHQQQRLARCPAGPAPSPRCRTRPDPPGR